MSNYIAYEDLQDIFAKSRKQSEQLYKERKEYMASHPLLEEGAVLDEEKSVRWNREEVIRKNNSIKGKLAAYSAKINQCDREVNQKIQEYLCSEFGFTEAVARIIFNEAYEDGHHAGFEEVASYARSYGLLVEQVFEAMDLR